MGQYLDITKVVIPAASPGTDVYVQMTLKNKYTSTVRAVLTGGVSPDGAFTQEFETGYADIAAGTSRTFYVLLKTPTQDSTIAIVMWYLSKTGYISDGVFYQPWDVGEFSSISITSITAPASATQGFTVSVSMVVKNNSSSARTLMGNYNYGTGTLNMSPSSASVAAGASKTFTASFTMPSSNVTLILSAFYVDPNTGEWATGDSQYRSISLVVEEPPEPPLDEFIGVITKKELDLGGGVRVGIPASDIPLGSNIIVRVTGKNATTKTQRMGIAWVIVDPDGRVRESYTAWEFWPYTAAGKEHEFLGGRFVYNKVGRWLIHIELSMNPDNQVVVDSYDGVLCMVVGEEEPEEPAYHHGYITDFKLKPGSTAADARFLVSFMAYAEDSPSQLLGWETKVTVDIDGYSNFDRQNHIGREGHRTDQEIRIGAMQTGTYKATVTLESKSLFSDWMELNVAETTVTVDGEEPPPPPPPPPPEEREFPVVPALLIAGGAALLIAAAKPKKGVVKKST